MSIKATLQECQTLSFAADSFSRDSKYLLMTYGALKRHCDYHVSSMGSRTNLCCNYKFSVDKLL